MSHLQNLKKQPSFGDCAKHNPLNDRDTFLVDTPHLEMLVSATILLDNNPSIYFNL